MKTLILKVEVPDDFPIDNNISFWIEISGLDGDGDRLHVTEIAKILTPPTEEEIYKVSRHEYLFSEKATSFRNGATWTLKRLGL